MFVVNNYFSFFMLKMNGVFMRSKKVNKCFRRIAEKQQHCQKNTRNDMEFSFGQSVYNAVF